MRRLFRRYDYLIAPTAQVLPFDAAETWPRVVAGQAMATYHEWMKGNCLVTMAGCPALAAPAGFSAGGLPVGLQIIAPVQQELACSYLAAAYEAAAPWARRQASADAGTKRRFRDLNRHDAENPDEPDWTLPLWA